MLDRVDRLNRRFEVELESPIGIGVGIHTGLAIVGRMGPPQTPVLTALGDTVNTAARLESITKDIHRPIAISRDSLEAAKLGRTVAFHEVELRGRLTKLQVAGFNLTEATELLRAAPMET